MNGFLARLLSPRAGEVNAVQAAGLLQLFTQQLAFFPLEKVCPSGPES